MSSISTAPFRPFPFLERSVELRSDAGGVLRLRSKIALAPVAPHIPALFSQAASAHPDRVWLAQRRGPERQWHELTYGAALLEVNAITQALLDLGKPGAPIVMLSENSLEHAVLQLAAMQARMPFVAITPAYSLLARDFTKLGDMVRLVEPAVIFAQDARKYQAALQALASQTDAAVVCVDDAAIEIQTTPWRSWVSVAPSTAVAESIARIGPDTVAKFLFSSGSTGTPKAITMTQRMLASSVAMHGQTGSRDHIDPPVNLSWLPWSHVAGGNGVFNNTIAAAGTIYLDGGKPVPGAFQETLDNLREISPTQYTGVPAGYAMLVDALQADARLAEHFFRKLRTISFSGARMPEFVHDRLQMLAIQYTGYRIPVISGWGMTESAAGGTYVHWNADKVGIIGLPQPGVELKLVPLGDNRYEARMRSPVVTPGYHRNPEQTAAAFDEEGFYRTGDALQFVDPHRSEEGLMFAGRVAEEFKLQTGTFVRVGQLRVQALESADGLLSDAAVTGADQAFVGLLAWLNIDRCRALCAEPAATHEQIAGSEIIRQAIRDAFTRHNQTHPASSMRIQRVLLLAEPPSLAAGEITDKGYINQRAVLNRRAALVERLHASPPAADVICIL
ncbi:MAG: feruloyl-CoA synthase [Pseudomonadota bacterium]